MSKMIKWKFKKTRNNFSRLTHCKKNNHDGNPLESSRQRGGHHIHVLHSKTNRCPEIDGNITEFVKYTKN